MKKLLVATLIVPVALLGAARPAKAGSNTAAAILTGVAVGIGAAVILDAIAPRPVVAAPVYAPPPPAPVVVTPPPVVYTPPPLVYEPPPVVYAAPPVVYTAPPVIYTRPPVVYRPVPVYRPAPVVAHGPRPIHPPHPASYHGGHGRAYYWETDRTVRGDH